MTGPEAVTVRESSECLKVKAHAMYRLVAAGEIPAFKADGSWRFRKSEIDPWTEANSVGSADPGKQVGRQS